MLQVRLPLPMMGFVIMTRAALAAGLALVFADRIPPARRREVGTALIAIGALTTVPIAAWLFGRRARALTHGSRGIEPKLIGATRFPRKGDEPL